MPRHCFTIGCLVVGLFVPAIGRGQMQDAAVYEEVKLRYPDTAIKVMGKWEVVEDKTKPPTERTTKTYRRTPDNKEPELLRIEVVQLPPRNRKIITNHQGGKLHGAYQFYENDKLVREGEYEHGLREGVWVERHDGTTYTTPWRKGRPDGLYEKRSATVQEQILFKEGRVIGKSGPESNLLLEFMVADHGRDSIELWIADKLRNPTEFGVRFSKTRLVDAVAFLDDACLAPFEIDRHFVRNLELPITADYSGLDLVSTLTLTLAPHGLACDCRYGTLWVTTAEGARAWRDPTGVSEVKPPPGSLLAAEWNRILPIGVEAKDLPLAAVIDAQAKDLDIEGAIDASRVSGKAFNVTANIKGQTLRHALGILLYKTNCRCKIEGGKLVILPPEAA